MASKKGYASANDPVTSTKGQKLCSECYRSAWETRREIPPKVYKHRNQRHRIIKKEKLLRTGTHGGSCNQEQPKRKDEDKLRKQGGSRRAAQKGNQWGWRSLRDRAAAVVRRSPQGESRRKTGLGVIRWQRKICDLLTNWAISEIGNPVIEK